MKKNREDLESLWRSVVPAAQTFDPQALADVPESVRAYLTHAIAAGAPLASAVRLWMHGRIKLGRWRKFKAQQVIVRQRGMIWQAQMRMGGLSVRGEDRFLDGQGAMRWKLAGVFPLARASGPDITRSAAGRAAAESIWLPSILCSDAVWWRAGEGNVVHARFAVDGHAAELALAVAQGRLHSVSLARWGNPDGGPFREVPFGAHVDQEATFDGYTIPARLRVGWYFDDVARFEREGKFLEVSIDDVIYR
jgi:hypothetical protein